MGVRDINVEPKLFLKQISPHLEIFLSNVNIIFYNFRQKNGVKNAIFTQITAMFLGISKKKANFARKLPKIAIILRTLAPD
jgi:hypothetical protein